METSKMNSLLNRATRIISGLISLPEWVFCELYSEAASSCVFEEARLRKSL
jgi:hypothetical protein